MRRPENDYLEKAFSRDQIEDKARAKELDATFMKNYQAAPIRNKFFDGAGKPVPERADVLTVGERLQVKQGWYEVVAIEKKKLILKPVKPTPEASAISFNAATTPPSVASCMAVAPCSVSATASATQLCRLTCRARVRA